jgi:hypothetical protein
MQHRLREEFAQVMSAQTFKVDDLTAGRAYIKAYVEFIHFVERLYDSTMQPPTVTSTSERVLRRTSYRFLNGAPLLQSGERRGSHAAS